MKQGVFSFLRRNGLTGGGSYSIRCGVEVGIHGGVGGSVSENDNVAGEPDGERRQGKQ